ncbi:MAG: hypothetical protein Ta2B_25040 [Termitinemataceae bacterium]|nr:MAG: hypothetical protein Ta2B_25040 [Termitinemataceae bacterium]
MKRLVPEKMRQKARNSASHVARQRQSKANDYLEVRPLVFFIFKWLETEPSAKGIIKGVLNAAEVLGHLSTWSTAKEIIMGIKITKC